jgi:ABC-2 type transport system permease protein
LKRYWRIYRTFFISSFVRELQFRANFFAKMAQQAVWVFFFVLILLVVYNRTETVAGWSRGDALVLAATLFFVEGTWRAGFFSLMEFPQQIRMGTLDFVLTKPVDTQFWVSTRRFNFDQIGTILGGVVMIVWGVRSAGLTPGFEQWLAYIALIPCSLAIVYAINVCLMTLAIWFVRVDNLWVLGETVLTAVRFPIDIFGPMLARVFTYYLPIALIATIPARQLVKGFDGPALVLGLIWACVALAITRVFFGFALRSYGSASS